jgi:hypothetical protein
MLLLLCFAGLTADLFSKDNPGFDARLVGNWNLISGERSEQGSNQRTKEIRAGCGSCKFDQKGNLTITMLGASLGTFHCKTIASESPLGIDIYHGNEVYARCRYELEKDLLKIVTDCDCPSKRPAKIAAVGGKMDVAVLIFRKSNNDAKP